jgi:cytochrome o ubiquinol oxidase operon protein cyoD
MSTQHYYEEIEALPASGEGLARAYVFGFALSLALTIGAYLLVSTRALGGDTAFAVLGLLACMQFVVQVYFFLHLGHGGRSSQERLIAFVSFSIIVLILVVGSLWVMKHLDARMMLPGHMETYMVSH